MSTSETKHPFSQGLRFIAGGVSGIFARFLFHPLDTVKARLQVAEVRSKTNVISTLLKIGRKEGILSYYAGFGSVCVFAFPGNALYFCGFEAGHTLAPNIYPLKDVSAGITAQLLANVVYTPMDVIKERRQTGVLLKNPLFDRELRRDFFSMKNGVNLFKGYWLSNFLWIPWSALYALGYNQMKAKLSSHREKLTPIDIFGCAFVAGVTASCATHPLDVLKTQLQVFSSKEKQLSTMNLFRSLTANEGVRGLYRGFAARVANIAPAVACSWTMYEMIVRFI